MHSALFYEKFFVVWAWPFVIYLYYKEGYYKEDIAYISRTLFVNVNLQALKIKTLVTDLHYKQELCSIPVWYKR